MQAIRTKYHPCTETKGSRISAKCEACTIYLSYDHGLNSEGNHKAAATALVKKMKWYPAHGRYNPLTAGQFDGAWYWVFESSWPDDRIDLSGEPK